MINSVYLLPATLVVVITLLMICLLRALFSFMILRDSSAAAPSETGVLLLSESEALKLYSEMFAVPEIEALFYYTGELLALRKNNQQLPLVRCRLKSNLEALQTAAFQATHYGEPELPMTEINDLLELLASPPEKSIRDGPRTPLEAAFRGAEANLSEADFRPLKLLVAKHVYARNIFKDEEDAEDAIEAITSLALTKLQQVKARYSK